jgi:putative transposase
MNMARPRTRGTRRPMETPLSPNQRWSLDFVSDQLTDGRRIRILAVVDDCSRECLALVADSSLSGLRVTRELDTIIGQRGRRPETIRGQIHIERHPAVGGSVRRRVALHRAWQAATKQLHQSFNGRLRDELLNETLFGSLAHARTALEVWRRDYNHERPHSKLGWQTPTAYASTFRPRRDLALRYAKGSAPAPAAPTPQTATPDAKSELTTG